MYKSALVTAVFVVANLARVAQGADFEEYARLVEQANSAHALLEGASPDLLPALRTNAVERDMAVIQWLDTFFASEEFATMAPPMAEVAPGGSK